MVSQEDLLKTSLVDAIITYKIKRIFENIFLLELELNTSKYGKEWSHIGDYLYNFYVKEDCLDQPKSILEVTLEQYTFLLDLYNNLS